MDEMRTYMEQMEKALKIDNKIHDEMMSLEAGMFVSLVGSMMDEYEAEHEDFSTVTALEKLLEVSKEVHKMFGRMKKDEEEVA